MLKGKGKKMGRLIEADAAVKQLIGYQRKLREADRIFTANQCIAFVENAPTVNAVEVARCGECKYYDEKDHNCLDEMAYARCWMPTDFCSFGERREE